MYFLFFIIGFLIYNFLLCSVVIIINFSIPYTKKLYSLGAVKDYKGCINNQIITCLILGGLTFILSLIFFLFIREYCLAYFIGLSVAYLFSLKKNKENPNNIAEYLTNYRYYLDSDVIDDMFNRAYEHYLQKDNNK